MGDPARGEIWLADFGTTRGHEQAGRRPVLILSVDPFNSGPADLAIVLPLTSTIRNIPTQVVVQPPEGGLRQTSAILCDAIRSISTSRLIQRWGTVTAPTLTNVETVVRFLLGL